MLDTLLEIGQVLRSAPDGLKHHRYVKPAPVPDKDNPVKFWRVPVEADGTFDFSQRSPLESEDEQKGLFYLNFKTSDADSLKKYVFGDIYRTVTKTGEDGNFRLGDPKSGAAGFRVNSFLRGEADAALFESEHLNTFRSAFRRQMQEIEDFLRAEPNAYIHFDFGGKAWHRLPEVLTLNRSVIGNFFRETSNGFVADAALYKTLGSGHSQTPGFGMEGDKSFRNRVFQDENEMLDLLYAIDYSTRSTIRAFDTKIIVLPRGEGLQAEQIERFFEPRRLGHQESAESQLARALAATVTEPDEMFATDILESSAASNITQFDFVFSKAGSGPSTPDADLIEISGLQRSRLSRIAQRVREVREEVQSQRGRELPTPKKPYSTLSITKSFLSILGDATKAKKKYQSHLFKVLPQIYTESYFNDPVLLPALIEKTEFNIRNDAPNFGLMRFDFYFLTKLQNGQGDKLMEIQSSPSYQIGVLLGKMARQFAGPKSPIKSFEKNYVGLLSRRIGTLADVIQLQNEINQKLIMHELTGFTFRISDELTQKLKTFPPDRSYDKNECAFGFFESYFAPLPKAGKGTGIESSDSPGQGETADADTAEPPVTG